MSGPPLSIAAAKAELRRQLLASRRRLPAAVRARADAAVLAVLADRVRRQRPATVAAHLPFGTEPGGPGLIDVLAGARLLLPVLLPDLDLDWAEYAGPDTLGPGPRGPLEPTGPRLGTDAVSTADLVVVPAVAVDRSGLRLGRGGGSYDRALARVDPATPVVALLHDGELLPSLPAEPHDRRVGAVVTAGDGYVELPSSAGRTSGP
ncbi:MAG TPA: 5-formyltetrahydrofolate cyclo-ligase [Micromonosporaceae bacterium]|nr:5-formyltetrahydrofolate cyclo-ligase [Micromonosporaceae bacterium]